MIVAKAVAAGLQPAMQCNNAKVQQCMQDCSNAVQLEKGQPEWATAVQGRDGQQRERLCLSAPILRRSHRSRNVWLVRSDSVRPVKSYR